MARSIVRLAGMLFSLVESVDIVLKIKTFMTTTSCREYLFIGVQKQFGKEE